MTRPPDPRPGDPILASHITYLYWLADHLDIEVVAPLIKTSDGAIALAAEGGFWIKLTGAPVAGKHPWVEQQALAGGTWQDGAGVGTTTDDPAREVNGSTADLTDVIVRAWRDKTSGEILFMFGACS